MKLAELKTRLVHSNVPVDSYGLAGGLPNEAYCIERMSDGKWSTYYSERGQRSNLRIFETEAEACEGLYADVVKYCSNGSQTEDGRS